MGTHFPNCFIRPALSLHQNQKRIILEKKTFIYINHEFTLIPQCQSSTPEFILVISLYELQPQSLPHQLSEIPVICMDSISDTLVQKNFKAEDQGDDGALLSVSPFSGMIVLLSNIWKCGCIYFVQFCCCYCLQQEEESEISYSIVGRKVYTLTLCITLVYLSNTTHRDC